jgi:CRP-like cAMP-binding protein
MFGTGHMSIPPQRTSEQTTRPESVSPRQNHLLAALPAAELEPLLQHMTLTGLALGAVLYEPGSKMDDVYFPISGVVSLI